MKKLVMIVVCVTLIVLSAAAETAAEIVNPIVEIEDDEAFWDELGIRFNSENLTSSELSKYIIAGTLGEVDFVLTNVDAEEIEWSLRFTKDTELSADIETMTGVYSDDWSEPVSLELQYQRIDEEAKDYIMTEYYFDNANGMVYAWAIDDVFYSLFVNGSSSGNQRSAVLDRIFEAIL